MAYMVMANIVMAEIVMAYMVTASHCTDRVGVVALGDWGEDAAEAVGLMFRVNVVTVLLVASSLSQWRRRGEVG